MAGHDKDKKDVKVHRSSFDAAVDAVKGTIKYLEEHPAAIAVVSPAIAVAETVRQHISGGQHVDGHSGNPQTPAQKVDPQAKTIKTK